MTFFDTADDTRSNVAGVPVVSRRDFLDNWRYDPGTHLTMLGPTQRGKTTLGLQLLDRSISKDHHALILSGKPPKRDRTMNDAAKKLNLKAIHTYPSATPQLDRLRGFRGYLLRPIRKPGTPDEDDETLRREFRKGLLANYRAVGKPNITFVDEAHHVQNDLKLKSEYEAPLMRGAPDNGVWSLIQRGRFMSYLAYDAPEHLFIFHDPDLSNQKRYSEIGGVDPKLLQHITSQLKTFRTDTGRTISQCVHIRRSGPEMHIIDVS